MRVGIVSLMHESNTFIPRQTTYQHFADDLLLEGESIREQLRSSHHEIGGFFAGLDATGVDAVPLFVARAIPYGPIQAETFSTLTAQLLGALRSSGTLDGLLVALHGAAVSEQFRDADGYLLSRIRETIGTNAPILVTLDAHANVSPLMVTSCDGLIVYQTNPHIDQRDRGIEAARLIALALRREVAPVVRAAFPPLVINIERQCTTEPQWNLVHQAANTIRKRPGVLSVSVVLGFPYADVEEMGASTIVISDNDPHLAQSAADELAEVLWRQRSEFLGQLMDIDQAVHRASQLQGPVCLLDMGDNVGGGSPGDGTLLVQALAQCGLRSFACLYDPESAQMAAKCRQGDRLQLTVGGKTDTMHGAPLTDWFRVVGLYDGRFEETEIRHGGARHFDQGLTAVVTNEGGLTLMVTSRRMPPFSLQQLWSCHVDPADYQVVVAKGVNAPLAAYQPVCPHFLRVDTPGVTTANLWRLHYHHRRRPLFPFE